MSSRISTTTPLASGITWTSPVQSLTRATLITGSVFADQTGTLYVDQGGDGENFDITTKFLISANDGLPLEVPVYSQYFRVRFVNNATPQSVLRVFVDIRDEYGEFLIGQEPSEGGAWVVLYFDPSRKDYQVVGRFDASNGWASNSNAAVFQGKSGKYASFPVIDAVVTQETLQTVSEHTVASF